MLGVNAAVEWFRATWTALSANRANFVGSVSVLGAWSMTLSRHIVVQSFELFNPNVLEHCRVGCFGVWAMTD